MEISNKPLLSICIPTFNGGLRLQHTIDCILEAKKGRPDVEIIVSDNCSNDEITKSIIKVYEDKGLIIANYNETNLGFNGNILRIIEGIAKGNYCWLLGDDDYIDQDAIDLLYPILNTEKPDYISLNIRVLSEEEYKNFLSPIKRPAELVKASFFKCLDINAAEGNILGTFMSTHVFRLESVLKVDRSEIRSNSWNTCASIFPNSYIMAKTFAKSDKCYCLMNQLLSAVKHPKNYSNKWENVINIIFPELYQYYVSMSGNITELKRNKSIIEDLLVRSNCRKLKRGKIKDIDYKYLVPHRILLSFIHHYSNK